MAAPRRPRAPAFGEELDALFMEFFRLKASYPDRKRGLLGLERRWLRRAESPARRLTVRRIIAKTLLTEAFGFDMPWAEFGRWLRRLQRLGFRDLGMRVHVACLYVQSLHLFPQRAQEAWDMLADVERGVRRLARQRPLRHEHLESIAHARAVARVSPPR